MEEQIYSFSAAEVILTFFLEVFQKGKSSLMMTALEQAW